MADPTDSESSASILFDPNDFFSIELKIRVTNITSQTNVSQTASTTLLEFGDHELVLSLPKNSCNLGHQVQFEFIRIDPKGGEEEIILEATGKIQKLDKIESQSLRVNIRMIQFEERDWQKLLSLYSSRQEEINKFLSMSKG